MWSERGPLRVVLLPAIPHGYHPHHMDFSGAITIGWDTFTRYLTDVGGSLAHHGVRRMLPSTAMGRTGTWSRWRRGW